MRFFRNFERVQLFLLNNVPLILLIVLFILFSLISSRFFLYQNLENIVKQASYIGIVAVGMTFVLLTAGIDLSVGSNMYLSAAVAGILIQKYCISVPLAMLACLLSGFTFGSVNAFLINRLRIIPFIATLGTMVAGRGLALLITKSQAVPFPESVIKIGSIRLLGIMPLPIVLFAIIVMIAHIFLKQTPMGRQIYAIGYDLPSAEKAGISTHRVLNVAYIFCGILAALGGFISVAQLGIVNAGFGNGDEFDAIAAAVLGGTSLFGGVGSVFPGTVLGAILIQMISAGLIFTRVNLYLQPLFTGAIIFLAVFLDSLRNTRLSKLRRRNIRIETSD
jgi:ribose transport system permease protein